MLDSTSLRELARARRDGDPGRMGERILEIVAARGKIHNPDTDSGGVLLGTVTDVGERFAAPPAIRRPDRDARLADPDAAATRGGRRASTRTRHRWRSPGPRTCSTARPGRRCPTTCRWRARSRSTTSAPPRRRCATAPGRGTPSACWAPVTRASSPSPRPATEMEGGTLVAVDVDAEAVEPGGGARPLRRRRDRRPAGPARRPRGGAGRRGRAGRPDGGGRERPGLRADRDPAHGGARHGAVLLDGDQLLGRGAGGRRDRDRRRGCWSAAATRPDRGAYALDLVRGSEPLRSALGLEVGDRREPAATRCRCAGGTSTASATSTTRSSYLPGGGAGRVPGGVRDQAGRVRGRALRGGASRGRSTPASRR